MLTLFFFNFYLFTYGCAGSLLLGRLSLVSASGGCYLVAVRGLLIAMASPVAERGLQGAGTVVAAPGLQSTKSEVGAHTA